MRHSASMSQRPSLFPVVSYLSVWYMQPRCLESHKCPWKQKLPWCRLCRRCWYRSVLLWQPMLPLVTIKSASKQIHNPMRYADKIFFTFAWIWFYQQVFWIYAIHLPTPPGLISCTGASLWLSEYILLTVPVSVKWPQRIMVKPTRTNPCHFQLLVFCYVICKHKKLKT